MNHTPVNLWCDCEIDYGKTKAGRCEGCDRLANPQLLDLAGRLREAEAEAAEAKNGLMVSEQYRRKYAEGKYALYAMGGEFTEAAAKHLPWGSEGPLERYERKIEREHSPLLAEHNAILVDQLKAVEAERDALLKDRARLDELEVLVAENPGGLLIHHQIGPVKWGGVGLGLSHRSLRKAIDYTSPRPIGGGK